MDKDGVQPVLIELWMELKLKLRGTLGRRGAEKVDPPPDTQYIQLTPG